MNQEYLPLANEIVATKQRVGDVERLRGSSRSIMRASWKLPSLTNSWLSRSNYEVFGYTIDNAGFVHLKGVVRSGASGSSIYQLPVEVRPQAERIFLVAASGGYGQLRITTSGNVILENLSGSSVTTWASLSGVLFSVEKYPSGSYPLENFSYSERNYSADLGPTVIPHPSGLVVLSGSGKTTSPPSSIQRLWSVSAHQGSDWQYSYAIFATNSSGSSHMRLDVAKNWSMYRSGNTGSTRHCFDGVSWPSYSMIISSPITLSSGVSVISDDEYPRSLGLFTDLMGMKWIGGFLSVTNASAGASLATIPAGSRPAQDLILPAMSNGAAAAVKVSSSGAVTFETAGTNGSWLSIAHAYWPSNE